MAEVTFTEVKLNLAIMVSTAVWTITSSALEASVLPVPVSPVKLGRMTAASMPNRAMTMSTSTRVKPGLLR